jgi:tRNA (Thr-GGU) A37 N-methylase
MDGFLVRPIGVVRSPYREADGTPVQPGLGKAVEARVEVLPEFAAGLADLASFDRVWLICWLDRAQPAKLSVAPARPTPIAISCVRLLAVDGNILRISELDILDGTPVLDIKPYVPRFDAFPGLRAGWLDQQTFGGQANPKA